MQITPSHTHYQLVYISFDISSFSVISYTAKIKELQTIIAMFTEDKVFHFVQGNSGNILYGR